MRFILKFISRLAEITLVLCVFAAAGLIWMNDKCTEVVNLKLWLGYDFLIFIGASTIGIIFEKLLKQTKDENKNR